MIRLEDLSKSFGGHTAVDGFTLDIPPGKITVFAGADGAGKSTLFKMILGLVHPDRGRIFLKGENINGQYERITSITGYMPERFSLYPDLSVEENLNFYADIHQVPKKRREELKARLLEKTGMKPFVRRRARALSGGMKQKLALSSILLSAPELIILDEPTTGVDPLSRIEFFHIIDDLKNEGKTILLSTPYLDEAEKGDLVVFMSEGRIFHTDQIDSLRSSFPARIFRLTPRDSVFDLMERLRKDDRFHGDLYLQGRSVVCLREKGEDVPDIQDVDIEEQAPRLEDMFLYYARRGMEKVE